MKPHFYTLLFGCIFSAFYLVSADDFKPGKAYPKDRNRRTDLPLSSFINQRSLTTDWSFIVLIRGEKHYILNEKANRELLSQLPVKGDVVMLDEAAGSFIQWRRQNPETETSVFWKANPQLLDQALRYPPAATESASSTSSTPERNLPEAQPIQSSVNLPPLVHPPTPIQEPTSATPWSIVGVLIVAATGLLWLLFKKRK